MSGWNCPLMLPQQSCTVVRTHCWTDKSIISSFFPRAWKHLVGGLLLLTPPNDDHACGVSGGQQTLITVEADVEHRPSMALQLVHYGLGVALHVKEVHAGILTASH